MGFSGVVEARAGGVRRLAIDVNAKNGDSQVPVAPRMIAVGASLVFALAPAGGRANRRFAPAET